MGIAAPDLEAVGYREPQRHLTSVRYSVDSRAEDGSLDRQVFRVLRVLSGVAACGLLALLGVGTLMGWL